MELNDFQSGAVLDTRPEEQKLKDFMFHEIVVSANPVNWVEKPRADWRIFPDQDQDGSGSCVMQTAKKLAGILLWLKNGVYVTFSAAFYQLRSNKPEGGMNGVEAFDIWMKNGLPLEQLLPSDKMGDAQLDALTIEQYEKDIAKVFTVSGHIGVNSGDFETVASIVQTTGKGVMTWFFFTSQEWSGEIPTVLDTSLTKENALRHSVTVVDFFTFGGKKFLLIEDSAHFGGITRRLISEEFFAARNWFARYPMSFSFSQPTPSSTVQHYIFIHPMEFGQTSPDIKALQDILKYEGLYPSNVLSSGYYGAITSKAVLQWQQKHNVAPLEELAQLAGRRVGDKTIAALNQIYGY